MKDSIGFRIENKFSLNLIFKINLILNGYLKKYEIIKLLSNYKKS
jgi:hypothetical protein